MRRARIVLFAVAIAGGCQKPTTTAVYVNLDRLLAQGTRVAPVGVPLPTVPRPLGNVIEQVPGSGAIAIRDPSNTPRLNVREMFQQEQSKAVDTLQRRLRQYYGSEANRFRMEQALALGNLDQVAFREANDRIRVRFEAWATERAPVFAKLTLLAGFPDPNPTSQPPARAPNPIQRQRLETADRLRTDLKTIDDRFSADCAKILAAMFDKSSASQADLQRRIEAFANELDRRAEREARAQIRNVDSQLEFRLADPTPVAFPGSPSHSVRISTDSPLDPSPVVPSEGLVEGTADHRKMLEGELRIWLALNRYRAVQSSRGVKDATQEFQLWRQQKGLGP